jgi:serine/threonine-protein kinase
LIRFLQFAVEAVLNDSAASLKEYVIGVDAFQRGSDFDPRIDPIVRVQARKLRAKLAQYYANEGSRDAIAIAFEAGDYAPKFLVRESPPPAPAMERGSIAVLPFLNLTEEQGSDHFSDGLTEELIHNLARVPGLRVVARTSVFAFKNASRDVRLVGTSLKTFWVLEGSVRASESRLRVTAQLIRTDDGFHEWSEVFDEPLGEILSLQERLADSIAVALRPRLGDIALPVRRDSRGAPSLDVYDHYLKGRFHWNRRSQEDVRAAIRHYESAIGIDPDFAPAYSALADCYTMIGVYGYFPPRIILPKAKQFAEKALALDPKLAEAHTALGTIQSAYEWQHEAGRNSFSRAIQCDPAYPDARQWFAVWHLSPMGQLDAACAELEAALRLDPLSTVVEGDLGNTLSIAGRHDEGLKRCLHAIDVDPKFFRPYWQAALIYERLGRMDEAIAAARRSAELSTGGPFETNAWATVAHALGKAGRMAEAREAVAQLEVLARQRPANPVAFVLAHLGLGDLDAAFEWTERCIEQRSLPIVWIQIDPRSEPMRDDPRYDSILERLNLPDLRPEAHLL